MSNLKEKQASMLNKLLLSSYFVLYLKVKVRYIFAILVFNSKRALLKLEKLFFTSLQKDFSFLRILEF